MPRSKLTTFNPLLDYYLHFLWSILIMLIRTDNKSHFIILSNNFLIQTNIRIISHWSTLNELGTPLIAGTSWKDSSRYCCTHLEGCDQRGATSCFLLSPPNSNCCCNYSSRWKPNYQRILIFHSQPSRWASFFIHSAKYYEPKNHSWSTPNFHIHKQTNTSRASTMLNLIAVRAPAPSSVRSSHFANRHQIRWTSNKTAIEVLTKDHREAQVRYQIIIE